ATVAATMVVSAAIRANLVLRLLSNLMGLLLQTRWLSARSDTSMECRPEGRLEGPCEWTVKGL
ncbi:MAG: hypothetical protein WCN81_15860, partial [Actinomycetes bacterium]